MRLGVALAVLLLSLSRCLAQSSPSETPLNIDQIASGVEAHRVQLTSLKVEGSDTGSVSSPPGGVDKSNHGPLPPTVWHSNFVSAFKGGKFFYATTTSPDQMRVRIVNTQIFDGEDTYHIDNYATKGSATSQMTALPASVLKVPGNK